MEDPKITEDQTVTLKIEDAKRPPQLLPPVVIQTGYWEGYADGMKELVMLILVAVICVQITRMLGAE